MPIWSNLHFLTKLSQLCHVVYHFKPIMMTWLDSVTLGDLTYYYFIVIASVSLGLEGVTSDFHTGMENSCVITANIYVANIPGPHNNKMSNKFMNLLESVMNNFQLTMCWLWKLEIESKLITNLACCFNEFSTLACQNILHKKVLPHEFTCIFSTILINKLQNIVMYFSGKFKSRLMSWESCGYDFCGRHNSFLNDIPPCLYDGYNPRYTSSHF